MLLEKKVLKALNLELTFYHRYVDYIVMAAPSEHINHIINTLTVFMNAYNSGKVEREENRCLNFLDLSLNVKNDEIIIN